MTERMGIVLFVVLMACEVMDNTTDGKINACIEKTSGLFLTTTKLLLHSDLNAQLRL